MNKQQLLIQVRKLYNNIDDMLEELSRDTDHEEFDVLLVSHCEMLIDLMKARFGNDVTFKDIGEWLYD